MTSHDVRDMLDLPGEAAPRPTKKIRTTAPRPVLKGLAREVQNLGGDNPIAIVPEATVFKKRRFGSRKPAVRWASTPFKNSGREDASLVLRHWKRKAEAPPRPEGEDAMEVDGAVKEEVVDESGFAKFNVQVNTPSYSDEQYAKELESKSWTKSETDYLMDVVKEYDLRWPVIWDRYDYQPPVLDMAEGEESQAVARVPQERTMEALKARYYHVAAVMLRAQKPVELMNGPEFKLLELMEGFNPQQELARKNFAELTFNRTKEETREEESLLVELKRILARSEKLAEERKELYERLDAPISKGNIGVYTSSAGLNQLVNQLAQVDKSKRRSLVGREGISPVAPSGLNQQAGYDRRDSSVRESISGPSGGNKKGSVPAPSDRRQLSEQEEQIYGVRRFERMTTTGPAFRHEKIQKPISSKSSLQQQKIFNVLSELRIPQRLLMPTYRVGEVFEDLVQNILILVDQRKVADKLQGEIDLLRRTKVEKEKAARVERGETEPEPEGNGGEVKRETSAAPSTSAHKRSASVLSAVSDKSTKRQKKTG